MATQLALPASSGEAKREKTSLAVLCVWEDVTESEEPGGLTEPDGTL